MMGWYVHSRCKQARGYYLDYLESSSRCAIPSGILTHLATCPDCQGQIHRLGDLMTGPATTESTGTQESRDAVMVDLLQYHFAYIETPVVCSMVKPFLPSLADPELEIRIPTPITAHVERCEACREDVAGLQEYHLNGGQLHRISRFLGGGVVTTDTLCTEVSEAITSVGSLRFEGVRPEALTHTCICPACRKRVQQHRAWLLAELDGRGMDEDERFRCQVVSATDLLDYVLPYELDVKAYPYSRFRQSFCEHVRRCPQCLAKIQQLQEQIFGMADRSDSGVMTYFSLPSVSAGQADKVGTVVIQDGADPPGEQVSLSRARDRQSNVAKGATAPSGRTIRILRTRPRIKAWAAAAALLLMAMGFIYLIPSAKAVTLSGIFHALEKAQNVHITMCAADDPRPVQEQWLSRELNRCLIRQRGSIVLWDWAGQRQKKIDLASGVVSSLPISNDMRVEMKERMYASFGMLPFDNPYPPVQGGAWLTKLPRTTRDMTCMNCDGRNGMVRWRSSGNGG
jgi:hypothetical protein